MMMCIFAFGMPGMQELLIVLVVVMLLFGANRLPRLMRSLGSSASEFRKGMQEGAADDDDEVPPQKSLPEDDK